MGVRATRQVLRRKAPWYEGTCYLCHDDFEIEPSVRVWLFGAYRWLHQRCYDDIRPRVVVAS